MRRDPESLYSEVGRRIAAERNSKKITQARLGAIVSLTRTSITNIEKGRQKVLLHTLFDIAEALGVAPMELLPHTQQPADGNLDQRLPDGLSDAEQAWIRAMVAPNTRGGV